MSHSTDPSVCLCCAALTALLYLAQGLLSDPNIDPEFLGMLVMVGINRKKFKPLLKAIKELYFKKFRGAGRRGRGLLTTNDTFVTPFFFLFLTLWRGWGRVPLASSIFVAVAACPPPCPACPLETAIAGGSGVTFCLY